MISKLREGLKRGADATLSKALRAVANRFVKRYGKLETFHLDLKARTIEATVALRGERDPLTVRIEGFRFVPEGEGVAIVVDRIRFSREWMTALAEDFVAGRPFPLPEDAAKAVRLLGLVCYT